MQSARLAFPVTLASLLAAPFLSGVLSSQESADKQKAAELPEYRCDAVQIQWFIPGQFQAALARAKREKRLLVIKGISFGVDDAGAKCATKGRW